MKIALVYDRINKFGGAEQVLLSLHELWPEAPIFTAVYNPSTAEWANVFKVVPSFLQYVPFAKKHHELFPWLTPLAFETFSFDEYDIVLSITSAEAKSVLTKPGTVHICYCLTPTRYLWSGYKTYMSHPGLGKGNFLAKSVFTRISSLLKQWDTISASRPDYYIAISKEVEQRVEKYYKRKVSLVIYPPVDTDFFRPILCDPPEDVSKDYFLVVSRLVSYKRIDVLIEAFNYLSLPLVVIGDGYERKRLKKMAGNNIYFLTNKLTSEELRRYYLHCRAFVFAAQEDFGIAACEAQSCGRPVIAYNKGGVSEIVIPGETGELVSEQSSEAFINVLKNFQSEHYATSSCRSRGVNFSKERFKRQIHSFVEKSYRGNI